jgi:hypothetical protein
MKMKKQTKYIAIILVALVVILGYGFTQGWFEAGQSITRKTDVIFDETGYSSSTLEFVPGEDMGDLECTVTVTGKGDDTVIWFDWNSDVQYPPLTGGPYGDYEDCYYGYIWIPETDESLTDLIDNHYNILSGEGGMITADGLRHTWRNYLTITKDDIHIQGWWDGSIIVLPGTWFTPTLDFWWTEILQLVYDTNPDTYSYLLPYINGETPLGWGSWKDGTTNIYSELGFYEDGITWVPEWSTPPIELTKDGNKFSLS